MKLTKTASLALTAALALGVFSAHASIGVTTSYQKINVSLVVTTNGPSSDNGTSTKYPVNKAKITNQTLLNLFAHWASIEQSTTVTWPSGAFLVMAWDWNDDVLVVDKTGTNVLYDATYYYNNSPSDHYFYINNFDSYGAYMETSSDSTSAYNYTEWDNGYFELYDDNYYLNYTYIWSYGPSTDVYGQNAADTQWHESLNFKTDGADVSLMGNGGSEAGTVTGSINSTGHNL